MWLRLTGATLKSVWHSETLGRAVCEIFIPLLLFVALGDDLSRRSRLVDLADNVPASVEVGTCRMARGKATGRSEMLFFFRSSSFGIGRGLLVKRSGAMPSSSGGRGLIGETLFSFAWGITLELEVLGGFGAR